VHEVGLFRTASVVRSPSASPRPTSKLGKARRGPHRSETQARLLLQGQRDSGGDRSSLLVGDGGAARDGDMVGATLLPGTGCDHGGRRGQGREGATGGQGPGQGHAASPGMRARRGVGHGGGGAQSDSGRRDEELGEGGARG